MKEVLPYLIGYLFSIVCGSYFVKKTVDTLHSSLRDERLYSWLADILGVIERILYTTSWLLDKPEFIGIWLAVKVAGTWKWWIEDKVEENKLIPGRARYNLFLIGTALSILYSTIGAQIVYFIQKDLLIITCFIVVLFLSGNWILISYIAQKVKD